MDFRPILGYGSAHSGPTKYAKPSRGVNILFKLQLQPSGTHGKGEIDSEIIQDPSVLEVPAINWARYVAVKSVQYVKKGHAQK